MKFTTNDGRFEVEVSQGKANIRFNLADFQGEFSVHELPSRFNELRKTLGEIAQKVETIAGLIRRDIAGD